LTPWSVGSSIVFSAAIGISRSFVRSVRPAFSGALTVIAQLDFNTTFNDSFFAVFRPTLIPLRGIRIVRRRQWDENQAKQCGH
jgi:hypothetical protein